MTQSHEKRRVHWVQIYFEQPSDQESLEIANLVAKKIARMKLKLEIRKPAINSPSRRVSPGKIHVSTAQQLVLPSTTTQTTTTTTKTKL
jgi:hypothetical protein